MRTVKTTIISILVVGLLAGSAVGAAAQDEATAPDAGAASFVAGEIFWTAGTGFEEETQSEGVFRQRGQELTGTTEMSDDRLDGEWTMRYDADVFPRGDFADILWGTVSIVGDEGAWEGRMVGTSQTDTTTMSGAGISYIELVGNDAYDGLSAILFLPEVVDPDSGQSTYPLNGVIFPGDLPPDR